MKNIPLLLLACVSLQAFAQTDTTDTSPGSATYTSVASLTRADIERLPAGNFMSLVQGAFPFVGNVSVVEEDYSFLVDGFVAINPNAINLSQIESIHFYPAGTALTRGSLARRGTFLIRMQPQKSGSDFSAKTGIVRAVDSRSATGTRLQYGSGFFSLNEGGYRHKGERSFFSGAMSYLRNDYPDQRMLANSSEVKTQTHNNRFRVSAIGGLQGGRRWSLDGGLFLTTQPLHTKGQTVFLPTGQGSFTNRQQMLYTSAHAGLQVSPSEKWSNRLVAEMSYAEEKDKEESNGQTSVSFGRAAKAERFWRHYAVTNHLSWKAIHTAALRLDASLVARYRLIRGNEDNLVTGTNGSNAFAFGSYGEIRSRSLAFSPNMVLHLHGLLTVEAGATYDDYRFSGKGNNAYKKLMPNGGLRLELASLLKGSGISTLELSSTYQRYQSSFERMDLLGTSYREDWSPQGPFATASYFNPQMAVYTPSKVWVSSLAVGWWQNRVIVRGSYRLYDEQIRTFTYFPGSYFIQAFYYEPLTAKNWSVELKTVLLQKPAAHWTLTAMAFHDKYERKQQGSPVFITTPVEPLYLDAGKAPLRGGLRTALTLKRFFLQAAALVNANEAGTDKNGVLQADRTTGRSHFLLAGYAWPLQGKGVKSLEVNLQSQNLLHSGTPNLTRYLGAGVQARF